MNATGLVRTMLVGCFLPLPMALVSAGCTQQMPDFPPVESGFDAYPSGGRAGRVGCRGEPGTGHQFC